MPGCENAADQENCENPKGYEDNKQTATPAAEAAMEQPKRSSKTPTQQEERQQPVLGQQQQGKPSRTDNCHCPEVSVSFLSHKKHENSSFELRVVEFKF